MIKNEQLKSLISMFRSAAKLHGEHTDNGDYRKVNAEYKKLVGVYKEIAKKGDCATHEFLELLTDGSVSVRLWAAYFALKFAPDQATSTLTDISENSKGHQALDAKLTLEQWYRGRLD